MAYKSCLGTNPIYCDWRFTVTMFVHSTSSIGISSASAHWNFCLLSQTWSCNNYCIFFFLMFVGIFSLDVRFPISLHSFDFSSSHLLSFLVLFQIICPFVSLFNASGGFFYFYQLPSNYSIHPSLKFLNQ